MDNMRVVVRNIVENVFNNWTALQLAVEHGMGGPQSHMVAVQFTDHMTDIFCNKVNIEAEEVEDIISDILDSEFHTICEDDSPIEVSRELWRLFQLCRTNKAAHLEVEMARLRQPACKLWLCRPVQPEPSQENTSSERPETPPQLMETDPDGWTTVPTRRKN